jgi:hypothetical protein
MRRREFIKVNVGSTTPVWPLVVRAQQPKMPVIGFMHVLSSENVPQLVPAFKQGLNEQGFVEGQNLAIDYRWAQGQFGRLPKLAADLLKHHVAVIAAVGGETTPNIAEAATHTIPIVFTANGPLWARSGHHSLRNSRIRSETIFRLYYYHSLESVMRLRTCSSESTSAAFSPGCATIHSSAHVFGSSRKIISLAILARPKLAGILP